MRIYRLGDEGPEIHDIQQRLIELGGAIGATESDGRFGEDTLTAVRVFQSRRSLRVDGLVGPDTWSQLVEAGYQLGDRTLYLHAPFFRGDDVRALQHKLNALGFDTGKEDGLHGPNTDRSLRDFQRNVGTEPDGIAGPHVIAILERMRPPEEGIGRAFVREREELRQMRAPIEGSVIAIDPAGPDDGPITSSIAESMLTELAAAGAEPVLLRRIGESPTPSERARIANDAGAGACVSVHLGTGQPRAEGPTCSYFGSSTTHSPGGRLLAKLILDELEHEFRCRGRLQRLTIAMLRETRMPAVQVEPAFATNGRGAAMIADPDVQRRVGVAMARGVGRFFPG